MTKDLMSLFNEFMFECKYTRKLKPATLKSYKNVIELFYKLFPNLLPSDITSHTIVDFFEKLETRERILGRGIVKTGIKSSTIATYKNKLSPFFEWLLMRGHVSENPCKALSYVTPSYSEKKYLSRSEVEKILTAIILYSESNVFLLKRNLLIFYLLLYCGLRRNELINIRVRDINLPKRQLTVRGETSKSGATRILPLHPNLIPLLEDYYKERKGLTSEYLLVSSRSDKGLTSDGLNHIVNRVRRKSKVKFHLHQLRHTFAVNFLVQNHNIVKLKQLLGHKNINMTMVYLRCLPANEIAGDIAQMNIGNFI